MSADRARPARPRPSWPPRSPPARSSRRRGRPRPTWTGSPPSTATCTRSCTSTPTARWRRPRDGRRAARRGRAASARWPASRWRSRTSSPPRACPTTCGLEDPRGLAPAVRRHRHRAAAATPASSSSARPTWTSSRWARPPRTPPTARPATRGTSTGSPAAPAAARPRRSPRSRRRWPSAPTPAARSASPPPSPASSASSRPTAGSSRYGLIAFSSSRSTRPGPCARTVLDAALLHEAIAGHDPLRLHLHRRAGARRCVGRGAARRRARHADRRRQRARRRGLPARRAGQRFAEAVELLDGAGRRGRRGVAARTSSYALRRLLPDRAQRVLVQPGPVRRHALRPAGRRRRHRDAEEVMALDPGAGLRRRGQAPHHPRHLRAVQRLLRRLLRPGAEGAHADHPGLRRRLRARSTCWSRRRRRPSRSRSASSVDDPMAMYLTDLVHDPVQPGRHRRRSRCPCGLAAEDGLPVGLQIMAPALADDRLYRVGAALEAALLADAGARPLLDRTRLPGRGDDRDDGAAPDARFDRRRSSRLRAGHRAGDPRRARHRLEDVLRLLDRRSAPSRTPRSARSASACPARCRWSTRTAIESRSASGWR